MLSRRKPDERRHSAGFVLVEVLVTAAVAAVLLAAVMRAYSSLWSGIAAVREETEAMLVARAVIEASTPRINVVPLTQEGMTGRYAWSIGIEDTGIVATPGQQTNPFDQQQQQQQPRPGQIAPMGQAGLLGAGMQTASGSQPGDERNNADGQTDSRPQEQPWRLFRIAVAVRAPSGRRTSLETYRLSRPEAR
jgi:type II secretory pathway pseudopilin PulG